VKGLPVNPAATAAVLGIGAGLTGSDRFIRRLQSLLRAAAFAMLLAIKYRK
jgi:hypothetical protein